MDSDEEEENTITQVMQKVLAAKQAHVKVALDDKWQRYNPVFIGGDLFTFGYLAFQGVQSLMPSLQTIAAIGSASLACGCIAGVIWLGVGLVELKEALQAFRNNDKILGLRMLIDFVCCVAVSAIMILTSLAIQVSVLAGIGAFLAANPWFLPVIFFLTAIPLVIELSYRIHKIATSKDLPASLQLDRLENLLNEPDLNWETIDQLYNAPTNIFNLKELEKGDEQVQIGGLTTKMEELQADMGVDAAIEVFALLKALKEGNRDQALEDIARAKKRIAEWNRSLYLRMFQQVLFIIGFGVSMGTLRASANVTNLLNAAQNFFCVGANIIPLYMDTFWPFKRNAPIVVPKVEASEVYRS
ncbi:MAG TPA: hypothetical protein VLE95_05985 [Chlamydiales bacterium]|nr:hypothetical protein [Chlamydiales bacterium]